MNNTINQLIEIQKRDSLTDKVISQRIEMHELSWNRIKNHRAGMGVEAIQKAVRAYPEIAASVLEDIFGDNWKTITADIWKQIIESLKEAK